MSFSASTCLTNNGSALGPTLDIYSNPISPSNPGTYVTNVPTNDITGGNCPYTFEVPDGTTFIRITDPITACYCDIPISDNDLCTTCNLNFNYYEPVTVGNIIAGDITGSCVGSVTDYIINWYETGDTVNTVFTSGKGTLFQPYDYVHPLTGTTSVLSPSGYYEAIIQKIKINGVVFSVTGGTGSVLADLGCLPSITNGNPIFVDALTCSNGGVSSDLPQYEHRFNYNAGTGGVLPIGLSTTFEFSANTNFFVWKFKGATIPDKIKFTFIGSSYPDPILLEYWEVGQLPGSNSNNYSENVHPNSADTIDYFYKATCLTGLTVNAGDNMLIEITPSTANTQTSWTFYCGCLDTFDCDGICQPPSATTVSGTTSYQFPVIESSITGVTGSCNTLVVSWDLSGCTAESITGNSFAQYTDLVNYTSQVTGILHTNTYPLYLSSPVCSVSGFGCGAPFCVNNGSTITYEKSPGLFRATSNSLSTISSMYSDYITCMIPRISSFSGDNTNVGYYRFMQFSYPNSVGSTNCGDGTTQRDIYIHQSSIITTGSTGFGDYFIEMTMPTVTSNITFTSCEINCQASVSSVVSSINSSSTGSTYNYTGTTTAGSFYDNSFSNMWQLNYSVQSRTLAIYNRVLYITNFQNETYPATGTTVLGYTTVPTYSGVTCPDILNTFSTTNFGPNAYQYNKTYSYIQAELFDPLDFRNFRLYACEITSNGYVTSPLVRTIFYEFSGGSVTYTNPEYLI
jgi:hypothetical protein